MKKVYGIGLIGLAVLFCSSMIPYGSSDKPIESHTEDYRLDNLRIEVNCLENEAHRKTQYVYVTARGMAVNIK